MPGNDLQLPAEQIPDHALVRCIGRGSYGQVWLARSVLGAYRAVKIVNRKTFPADRPFEREFTGVVKFEPISRTHPGFVSLLHVGRNYPAGYFYTIMEVADDDSTGQKIDPVTYNPKTLGSELNKRGKLPVSECLRIALSLANALGYLHQQGLVHRDIKPSNIIFVNGIPKFADIGLVADIGESATFVGTEGYVPPEGPGRPMADIYSFGKVLYEVSLGRRLVNFPELPADLDRWPEAAPLRKLYQIILKACDLNSRKRFQTAQELHDQLARLSPTDARAPGGAAPAAPSRPLSVAILYQPNVQPDERLMNLLQDQLVQKGHQAFVDKHVAIDVEWARAIEEKVTQADAVIVLLSPASLESEMLAYEVELAHQTAHQQAGKCRLLSVRIQLSGPLPGPLASALDALPQFHWEKPHDDERLVRAVMGALQSGGEAAAPEERAPLEPIGGAVPLDSKFYVVRRADAEFESAIARGNSIVLVKGARQMGKTSLLARGLQRAREEGAQVVLSDFQKFNVENFRSLESFYLALGESLADQLDLDLFPKEAWDERRSPNANFERYVRREALEKLAASLVWGLDEVDRLFTCPFGSEVFSLLRSWHNKRALDPQGPWSKLTLAIAYATEASLFITDLVQSPFNIGTRVALEDFRPEQVEELNQRYGNPLPSPEELARFTQLVGGQPFLVRRGLHELATQQIQFAVFETHADRDGGIFGDHLRRILMSLAKDPALADVVRTILEGRPCPHQESFYRLRSAGLMIGDALETVRPRCQLYATFLKRHLL